MAQGCESDHHKEMQAKTTELNAKIVVCLHVHRSCISPVYAPPKCIPISARVSPAVLS